MIAKTLAALTTIVLVLAYLLPPAIKLNDPALAAVIAIGIALMLVDLVQSLCKRD